MQRVAAIKSSICREYSQISMLKPATTESQGGCFCVCSNCFKALVANGVTISAPEPPQAPLLRCYTVLRFPVVLGEERGAKRMIAAIIAAAADRINKLLVNLHSAFPPESAARCLHVKSG